MAATFVRIGCRYINIANIALVHWDEAGGKIVGLDVHLSGVEPADAVQKYAGDEAQKTFDLLRPHLRTA